MGEGDHPKEDGSVLYASEFNEVRRSAVNSFSVGAVALVTAIRLDKVAVRSYPVPVTMGWQVDALVDSSMRSATSTISLLPIQPSSTNYGLIELHSQKKLFSDDLSDAGDWTVIESGADASVSAAQVSIGGATGTGSSASTQSKTGVGNNGYIGLTVYEFGGTTDRTITFALKGATSGTVNVATAAAASAFASGVYDIFIASDSQTCDVYKNGSLSQGLDISSLVGDITVFLQVVETSQTSNKGIRVGDGTTACVLMGSGNSALTWISSAITLPAGSKGIQVAVYDENGDFPSNVTVEVSSDNGANYTVVTENGKGVDTGNAGTQGIIKLTFTSAVPTDKVRMVAFSGCE